MPISYNIWPDLLDSNSDQWFEAGMPPDLTAALNTCGQDGILALLNGYGQDYVQLTHIAARLCRANELRRPHAYRCLDRYTMPAYGNLAEALEALHGTTKRDIPLALEQAAIVAMLVHNTGFPAAVLRVDADPEDLLLPELGLLVSNEWVAAYAADKVLGRAGVAPLMRFAVWNYAVSMTLGENTLRGKSQALPCQPNKIGLLMRAAAISGGGSYDFEVFAYRAVATYFTQKGFVPPPADWPDFLEILEEYWSEEVVRTFDLADAAFGVALTATLGWRTYIEHCLVIITALRRHHAPHERSRFAQLLKDMKAPFC